MTADLTEETIIFLADSGRDDLARHVRALAAKSNRGRPASAKRREDEVNLSVEMNRAIADGEPQALVLERFWDDPRVETIPPDRRAVYLFNTLKGNGRRGLRARVREKFS